MKEKLEIDFTEQDILDSFDFFMENAEHKKREYSLTGIIMEFLAYLEDDIVTSYGNKSYIIKRYIKNVCFNNKEYLYKKYGK